MSEPVVKVNKLNVAFNRHPVLTDLSVELNRGEFLAIVGQNGVGKTTFVRTLLKQLKPASGEIIIAPGTKIGYVPQFRNIDVEYPLSIKDFISLGFTGFKLPFLKSSERKVLDEVIKMVDLQDIAKRSMGRASGGEKQRAYLAAALIKHPNLLILDESTASLDPNAKRELLAVVKKLNVENQLTVIFITHDVSLVSQYPDHYLWMKQGEYESGLIENLPSEVVSQDHA
ncbi:ABC transporter ATP-binding protein [Lentilactobacillus curieae]|uniref:ABC transporter ATP-binding protein n=1 Tax=Lentilactobacillus curieae TaxID=1138822 RepID=A0A1S6QJ99_9LACO|nr:ATP-binding cassette domain-containing protein [Lentilactobacillus curieae]AQW21707.1 ABC transporter ATP-binding protein [Lentilactobacillus curieae]